MKARLSRLRARLSWTLRHKLWHLPLWQSAYLFYLRSSAPGLHARAVAPDTDLVVEAYPRSANTFLVHALELISDGDLKIAHHLHDPVQIAHGARRGIPVVVVVRPPLDAVTSWQLKAPWMPPTLALNIYISFYRVARAYGDAVSFVAYEDLIQRPQEVLARIYDCLDRAPPDALASFDNAAVFASIDQRKQDREGPGQGGDFSLSVARPTAEKEAHKAGLQHDIATAAPGLLTKANEIFEECMLYSAIPVLTGNRDQGV